MKQLSPEALDVLSGHVAIDGAALRITKPLDRKLYVEVNAALEALGGEWDKKSKTHRFSEPPADAIDSVLMDGGFHDRKKDFDQFFTPAPLARRIVAGADVHGKTVLEPSAGGGRLAFECLIQGAAKLDVVELDPALLPALRATLTRPAWLGQVRRRCDVEYIEGNFLNWRPAPDRRYERIVMNPPFSKRADVAHVLRAFNLLEPRGRLVAIASAGVKFRQDALALDLRTLIRRCGSVEPLPDGSFSESGTDVRTVLVTLEAP
jgi:predicted RNA methylase